MSYYFKIFITVVLAVIVGNVTISTLFTYWYQSETDLAIQQSKVKLEKYQKANAIKIASMENHQKQHYSLMINKQLDEQINRQQRWDRTNYENKLKYNANKLNKDKNKKLDEDRRAADKKKRETIRAKERLQQKNRLADKLHIRRENLKTCNHWTKAYKLNPTIKNKNFKRTSCNRVYQ